jgi:hypothetical protein
VNLKRRLREIFTAPQSVSPAYARQHRIQNRVRPLSSNSRTSVSFPHTPSGNPAGIRTGPPIKTFRVTILGSRIFHLDRNFRRSTTKDSDQFLPRGLVTFVVIEVSICLRLAALSSWRTNRCRREDFSAKTLMPPLRGSQRRCDLLAARCILPMAG